MKRIAPFVVCLMAAGVTGSQAETWTHTAGTNSWDVNSNWTPATFPSGTGAVANISGDFSGDQTINLNQGITVGSLTINDTGANPDSTIAIAAGTSGSLTFQVATGSASLSNSSNSMNTISANVAINSNITINTGNVGGTSNGITISGNLSGAGTITKTGNNSSLNLTGDNSNFLGKWVFNSGNGSTGRISINSDSSLGAVPGAFTSDFITVSSSSLLHLNGSFTLNANRGITVEAGSLALATQSFSNVVNIAGNITGAGGITRNSSNTGVVILSGSNNYTGGTSVSNDTLRAGSNYAFGNNSAVTMGTLSGGRLELAGFNNSIGSLAGTGAAPTVSLGSATLTTGGNNTSTTYAGQITGVGGGFTKIGTGTQTLSGSSNYTGATNVNAGTLLINGILGNTAVSVNNGGTLAGTGTIGGSVSVISGGVLAPGASIESLNTGAVSFASGATFAVELDTNLGTSDLLIVTGNLSITGGALLTLSDLGSNVSLNAVLTLIDYSGSWNGGFFTYNGNELADGETFAFGANDYTIDYDNGTAVTLTAVPEPAAAALTGLALGWMLIARRKRA